MTPVTTSPRRRMTRNLGVGLLAAGLAAAGSLALLPTRASAAVNTLYINNAEFGTAGTCVLGNDYWDSAPNSTNNQCSLGAALAYANQNSTLTTPWTITLASNWIVAGGGQIMVPTNPSLMTTAAINPLASNGAYYTITRPMTVHLMNRLAILEAWGQNSYTTLYINASNVNLLYASYIESGASGIVVSGGSSNVKIDQGDTLPQWGDLMRQFLVIQNGAQNVTFSNYNIGNLFNGPTDNCASAAVCFHPGPTGTAGGTTTNVTIDAVTFKTSASAANTTCTVDSSTGCVNNSIVFATNTTNVNGLTISNSSFTGLKKATDQDAVVLSAKAGPTLSNLTFRNNAITNSGSCTTAGSPTCTLIQLPSSRPMGGTNSITNNTFINDPALSQPSAIVWQGGSSGVAASNLTIQGNSFDGFAASSIWLDATGTVTVRQNTFGANSYSNTTSQSGVGDETGGNLGGATGAMFANVTATANQKISTWHPLDATIGLQGGTCTASVDVTSPQVGPTPADPVAIDLYWTATNKAERYLGVSATNINGPTQISFAVPPDLIDPDLAFIGNLRLQTHSMGASSQLQSSQYSRTISVTGTCAIPDFALTKVAYSDSARTVQVSPGTVLPLGSTVYFAYVLENLCPTSATVITEVTDSQKPDGPVCTNVTLQPGQIDTTSCLWQQVINR